ncbi:hypothetical protein V8F06_012106 [Rhypophila decipiens]
MSKSSQFQLTFVPIFATSRFRSDEGNTMRDMSEYKYNPLPSSRHVRVLRLWPRRGSVEETVRCNLEVEDIAVAAELGYEALSYSWEGNPTAAISCSGKTLRVTENAKKALLQLRPRLGFRRVWIDAVCIKQQAFEYVAAKQQEASRSHGAPFNPFTSPAFAGPGRSHGGGFSAGGGGGLVLPTPTFTTRPGSEESRNEIRDAIIEMNHQLALMCEIYQHAKKVIIWVGDTNKEVVQVFKTLITPGIFRTRRLKAHSILSVLKQSWFERLWTLQELVMSREAELMCGPYSISWDSFVDIGSKVLQKEDSPEESSRSSKRSNVTTWSRKVADPTILRRLVGGEYYHRQQNNNADLVSTARILSDASRLGGSSAWYLLSNQTNTSEEDETSTIANKGPVSLALVLPLLTSRKCTLAVDRVFGFYGILERCGVGLDKPDSSKDVEEVFRSFTKTIIQCFQTLGLWAWLPKLPGMLPGQDHTQAQCSWIVDLNSPVDWSHFPAGVLAGISSTSPLRGLDSTVVMQGPRLSVVAKVVDAVEEIVRIPFPGQAEYRTSRGYSGCGTVHTWKGDILISIAKAEGLLAVRRIPPALGTRADEAYKDFRLVGWAALKIEPVSAILVGVMEEVLTLR